jgi:ABC-type transport system involved in cytochrome bd biosynthesis fused ATPase/permease subunit
MMVDFPAPLGPTYVPQQSVMFEGTIRFNLALGARPGHEVTQDELEDTIGNVSAVNMDGTGFGGVEALHK